MVSRLSAISATNQKQPIGEGTYSTIAICSGTCRLNTVVKVLPIASSNQGADIARLPRVPPTAAIANSLHLADDELGA